MTEKGRRAVDHEVHLPGDDIRHRGTGSLVRHMDELDTRLELEQLRREMRRAAIARTCIPILVRIGLDRRDDVFKRRAGDAVVGEHDQRYADHEHDRLEALDGIVGELLIDIGPDAMRGHRGFHERVAIGIRSGSEVQADDARSAGTIVDDDLLTQ